MEQCEELRHNAFHLVGHEHLVAVELYLVALQVDVAVHAWEVEYAGEMEREVNVQVNPKQRLILHWVELTIKLLVVFVFQRRGRLCPQRLHIINNVVGLGLYLLAVFPLRLLAKGHGHWHEAAILCQQCLDLVLLQILLAIVGDVQNDVGAAVGLLCLLERELWRAVTRPVLSLRAVAIALGDDLNLVRHHEG